MKRDKIVIRIVVDRRVGAALLAVAAVGALALRLSSETLTLETTYPAPVGVYNQIVTTGNSGAVPADTTLARNAGNVVLAPAGNPTGKVGVGTATPQAKLDVAGTVRVGALPGDPPGVEGTMYYNSAARTVRVFNGAWTDMSGSPQGGLCGFTSTSGLGTPVTLPCLGKDAASSCPGGYQQVFLGVGTTCVKR